MGALHAARMAGIETGGWACKGWETEIGPRRTVLSAFGLVECSMAGYPARTAANVRDSDGTLWFGDEDYKGFRCTMAACDRHSKRRYIVRPGIVRPSHVAEWIRTFQIGVLNVAGTRESLAPGIEAKVEAFLGIVFKALTCEEDADGELEDPGVER